MTTQGAILVTGAAGFIGYHLCQRLLRAGRQVVGIDNLNPYYSVALKRARLEQLVGHPQFRFEELDIAHADRVNQLFADNKFSVVFNLAAQAGVRYSLINPHAYVQSNLVGFVNILEACRHNDIGHLVFASSSSVYGAVTAMPFSVHQNVDHPLSIYAASKKSNELLAHSYSHLFGLPVTGLRFFTVYGPWGRPDMALYTFTEAILAGRPIKVFNNGDMARDFTYVDDVVEGLVRVGDLAPQRNAAWDSQHPDPSSSAAPYRIYNIGNNKPVPLLRLIAVLEECLGAKAQMEMLPMQPGDVPATFADVEDLARDVGFAPDTPIEVGVKRFVEWYRDYHETPVR